MLWLFYSLELVALFLYNILKIVSNSYLEWVLTLVNALTFFSYLFTAESVQNPIEVETNIDFIWFTVHKISIQFPWHFKPTTFSGMTKYRLKCVLSFVENLTELLLIGNYIDWNGCRWRRIDIFSANSMGSMKLNCLYQFHWKLKNVTENNDDNNVLGMKGNGFNSAFLNLMENMLNRSISTRWMAFWFDCFCATFRLKKTGEYPEHEI